MKALQLVELFLLQNHIPPNSKLRLFSLTLAKEINHCQTQPLGQNILLKSSWFSPIIPNADHFGNKRKKSSLKMRGHRSITVYFNEHFARKRTQVDLNVTFLTFSISRIGQYLYFNLGRTKRTARPLEPGR